MLPKTSRALLLAQSILVVLQVLASATVIGDIFPGPAFPIYVVCVGGLQAGLAYYQYRVSTMTRGLLVVLAVLAGLQAVTSGANALTAYVAPNVLALAVILVGAVQAGAALYARSVTSTSSDPPPYEPGRLSPGVYRSSSYETTTRPPAATGEEWRRRHAAGEYDGPARLLD